MLRLLLLVAAAAPAAALSGLLTLLGQELAAEYDLCNADDVGVDQGVQATCLHQGKLYAGGLFNLAGNSTSQNFAVWDGAKWTALSPVGPVLDSTTPTDDLDVGVVFALACPESDAEHLYVGGYFGVVGDPNVTVNNFARYDVASDTFEALVSARDASLVGFSAGSGADAAVLDLSCVSDDCTDLYVGGYFSQALEWPATGVARLDVSDWAAPAVTVLGPAAYDSDDCLLLGNSTCDAVGVDGAVMAVQALPNDAVLFGGLFVSAGSTPMFMAGQWQPSVGPRCIQYSTALTCSLPILCCQSLSGAVYEIVPLSKDRFLLGGSFSNELFATDAFGVGNVSVVDNTALVRLETDGRVVWDPIVRNGTQDWANSGVLGTDGEVTALRCAASDGAGQCTELLLGGNFSSVFASDLSANDVVTQEVYLVPDYPVVRLELVWDDSGAVSLGSVDAVITDQFTAGPSANRSVAALAVDADAGAVFVAGVLPDLVNVARVSTDDDTTTTLPEAPIAVDEDSLMYYCVTNVTDGVGNSFCCPSGSICPTVGVQIPCPTGWGYYCGPQQTEPAECEEGYYCETPGTQEPCPRHYYCPPATVEPKRCWPSFMCTVTRLARPDRDVSVLSCFACIVVFFFLISATGSLYRAVRDFLRRRRERLAAPLRKASARAHPDAAVQQLISPVDYRADLGFQNVGVRLRNRKIILNNVSGVLRSGRVTAVMGPSGCGKTTFLSAMSNRIMDGGVVLGKTFINGKRRSLTALQDIMGFVPQEDTMHRDLTVKQTINFYMQLKGNPEQSAADRKKQCQALIEALDLSHVRHSLIGDEETRGVSGGQRKRVNVAIELTGNPLILFLDEPTSGLDSTSSESLIRCLHNFAEAGLTIAMVIHQPRVEVLALIDDVVLLGKGGHQVFAGSVEGAVNYFAELGHRCPDAANPSDFFLDIITENPMVRGPGDDDADDDQQQELPLVQYFSERRKPAGPPPVTYEGQGRVPERSTPSVLRQTLVMAFRSFVQQSNNKATFMMDSLLLILIGMLVGFLDVADQQYQLASMAIGLTAALSGIRVFGPEQVVTWRETSAGISTVAYYVGKMLAQIPNLLIAPVMFLSLYYPLKWPEISVYDYYITLLATQCSCSALGYFVSTLVNPKNAQVAGVVSALVSILFAGTTPSAKDLSANTLGQWGMAVSYARWCMAGLYIKQAMNAPKPELEAYVDGLDKLGYSDVDWSTQPENDPSFPELDQLQTDWENCLWRLLELAGVYNVLAFACLCYVAKKRARRLSLLHMIVWCSRLCRCFCCCCSRKKEPGYSAVPNKAAAAGADEPTPDLSEPLLADDLLPDVAPSPTAADDDDSEWDDSDDELSDRQRAQERLMNARDFIKKSADTINRRVNKVGRAVTGRSTSAAPNSGMEPINIQDSTRHWEQRVAGQSADTAMLSGSPSGVELGREEGPWAPSANV